ncbi:hypothetical protein Dsin_022102 [Dipteronia sinensis]|uniref:Retrotransposon gag domain-containing protein n=1 Tax=Dipteronia sinensis TaxID=43782 RepID=A0AAE0E0U4_9ROSI|nr:hypothetical protein Dsin_022102 [Dipteronia sinensis]
MLEREFLQLLKEEFKAFELLFNKGIDRMLENIRKTSSDPKGSANKVFSSSNLESAKQNFPEFDGSDPKLWIRKCDRAFLLHPVPQDQKVLVASSQFEKEAEMWYQLVYARRVGVTWREFKEAVLDRFLNEKQELVV